MSARRVVLAVAGAVALLGVVVVAFVWKQAQDYAAASEDPGHNSSNIHLSGGLTPTQAQPLAGFWKTECSEDFGLAVAVAEGGLYSVSFCGPGGCFKPGTYRPNTTLTTDPEYKVENSPLRVAVRTREGKFMGYQRCWPTDPR